MKQKYVSQTKFIYITNTCGAFLIHPQKEILIHPLRLKAMAAILMK